MTLDLASCSVCKVSTADVCEEGARAGLVLFTVELRGYRARGVPPAPTIVRLCLQCYREAGHVENAQSPGET